MSRHSRVLAPRSARAVSALAPLLLLLLAVLPGAARAAMDYHIVAIEGGPATAMGAGATFSTLQTPVVNGLGEVAFVAGIVGPGIVDGASVWTDAGGAGLRVIAHGDMAAPGVSPPALLSGPFRFLNLNDAGRVGFMALLDGVPLDANSGIWVTDAQDALILHAREGAPAPGTPWTFGHFGQSVAEIVNMVLSENGEVAFELATSGGGDGVWSGAPGAPLPVAIRSASASAGGFEGFQNNVAIDPQGRTCFAASVYTDSLGGTAASIWAETNAGLVGYAMTGSPGEGGFHSGFDEPKRNADGVLVFDGSLQLGGDVNGSNNTGVWIHDGGASTLVARESGIGPGSGGTFLEMNTSEAVINDRGDVLFYASMFVGGASVPSLWLWKDGVLSIVAIKGQTAPDTEPGTTFSSFTSARRHHINAAGDIVFYAVVDGPNVGVNRHGVWRYRDGMIEKVIRQGDMLETSPGVFREVATIDMEGTSGNQDGRPKGLGEGGHVAFYAGFWSGHDAIVVAEPAGATGVDGLPPRGEGPALLAGRVRAQPNPARAATSFAFELARDADVRVEVFDVAGRRVFDSGTERRAAGPGEVRWDGTREGRSAPAGLYLYRVSTGEEAATGKLLRLR